MQTDLSTLVRHSQLTCLPSDEDYITALRGAEMQKTHYALLIGGRDSNPAFMLANTFISIGTRI